MTAPERIWTFDRYVNGVLMAEGVQISRAASFEGACVSAARLASRGPNGEVPVLVLASSPTIAALIAEARREWRKKLDRIADEIDEQVKVTRAYVGDCGMDHNQKELMKICTSHFLDKAATIRALKEETP